MPTEQKSGYGLAMGAILLVVVALVAWFGYNSIRTQSLVDQTLREQFEWALVPAQPDPTTPGPRTSVNLKIADANLQLGVYEGDCKIVDGKNTLLLEGELSGVVCTLIDSAMGGGTEIGIFREGGELILKKGYLKDGSTRGSDFVPIVKE